MLKVLVIIQARTGSQRLPKKVLKEIEGKTMLEHIVDFLKYCKKVDDIIVATTTLKQDNQIETICLKNKIKYFRGSSSNVLKRYYDCATHFKGDIIVRITADNPLIDPNLVDKIIQTCKKTNCDYASNMINQTYPFGYLVEAFTFNVLEKLHRQFHDLQSKEHVTFKIRQNPNSFHVEQVLAPNHLRRPSWRLTVDHKEDFELISQIFSKLYIVNSYIKYEKVVNLLDDDKKLLDINKKWH